MLFSSHVFCFAILAEYLENTARTGSLSDKIVHPLGAAPWQFWNQIRTAASGLAFLLMAYGALRLQA